MLKWFDNLFKNKIIHVLNVSIIGRSSYKNNLEKYPRNFKKHVIPSLLKIVVIRERGHLTNYQSFTTLSSFLHSLAKKCRYTSSVEMFFNFIYQEMYTYTFIVFVDL